MTKRQRVVDGVVFVCHRSGLWFSQDMRWALVRCMRDEWHLFQTRPGPPPIDVEDVDFCMHRDVAYETLGGLGLLVATITKGRFLRSEGTVNP